MNLCTLIIELKVVMYYLDVEPNRTSTNPSPRDRRSIRLYHARVAPRGAQTRLKCRVQTSTATGAHRPSGACAQTSTSATGWPKTNRGEDDC